MVNTSRWLNRAKLNNENVLALANQLQVTPAFAAILQKRNININSYLADISTDVLSTLPNPRLLPNIEKGCKIIESAIRLGIKIGIVNDYDVDGATSGVILKKGFQICGADNVLLVSPNRHIDGYGISRRIIDYMNSNNVGLIVTCDNGISAIDEIHYAKSLGINVVVTDHHDIPYIIQDDNIEYTLPDADVIINPKLPYSQYPFKEICGANVAHKVIQVLFDMFGIEHQNKQVYLNELLELVTLATICDVMPLVDENRDIVRRGMTLLQDCSYIGLRQLMHNMNIKYEEGIKAFDIAFRIGPALNSCGRLIGTSDMAMNLLLEKNYKKTKDIADVLVELNNKRKDICSSYESEAFARCENNLVEVIYIPASKSEQDTATSIMGIVAAHVKESLYKPVICLTDAGNGILKGSGRSIPGYHLFDRCSKFKYLLEKFGGHELAAGLSIKKENLEEFKRLLNEDAECLRNTDVFTNTTLVDLYLPLSNVSRQFVNELSLLEPIGKDNEEVVLCSENIELLHLSRFGKNKEYIMATVKDGEFTRTIKSFSNSADFDNFISNKYTPNTLKSLYNGQEERGVFIDILYSACISSWNNEIDITIKNYM